MHLRQASAVGAWAAGRRSVPAWVLRVCQQAQCALGRRAAALCPPACSVRAGQLPRSQRPAPAHMLVHMPTQPLLSRYRHFLMVTPLIHFSLRPS